MKIAILTSHEPWLQLIPEEKKINKTKERLLILTKCRKKKINEYRLS